MAKVGVLLLADTDTPEAMGRMANALTTVRDFKDAGEEVSVFFDGAGTKWVPELSSPEHKYHELLAAVDDKVGGACSYCASAYGVKDRVEGTAVPLLDEYAGHPSVQKLVSQGYQVLTF